MLAVSIVFVVYKQNLTAHNLKNRTAVNVKISVFVICVEAITYLLLYNSHDCTFNKSVSWKSSHHNVAFTAGIYLPKVNN